MIPETEIEFLQAVWNRRTNYTYIVFGTNILVFLLMTLAGGATNVEALTAFGVKSNGLINQGEYWRLVTPVFIHIGLLHLVFNSYAVWLVGPQVEKLYGGGRFVMLYLLTGVAGVIGSYLYHPDVPSAGASGAIFGLFGVLLVFGIRNRDSIPANFRRSVGAGVLPVIVINLFIGYMIPQVDNSAHISGLLAGMALAAVITFDRPGARAPAVLKTFQIALIAMVGWSGFQVVSHYNGPRLSFQNVSRSWTGLSGGRSTTREFTNAVNNAERAFDESMSALEANDDGTALSALGKSIDELRSAQSLSAKSDEITSNLLSVMQSQYELLQNAGGGTKTLMRNRQAVQNANKFRELQESLRQWVESEGERYGIQLRRTR